MEQAPVPAVAAEEAPAEEAPASGTQVPDEAQEDSGETHVPAVPAAPAAPFTITIRDQHGGEVIFRSKRSTKFGTIAAKYCEHRHLNPNLVKFIHDGQRLRADDKVCDLVEEDENEMDVEMVIEQTGGR